MSELEGKVYTIADQKFILKKFKVGQFKRITELFGNIDIKEDSTFPQIITQITDNKIETFMSIIFEGQPVDKVKWSEIDYDTVDEVIDDFFLLNGRLKMRLMQFFATLLSPAGIAVIQSLKNSGSILSPSTSAEAT